MLVGSRAAIAVGEKLHQTAASTVRRCLYRVAVSDRDPLFRLVERELMPYVPRWSLRRLSGRYVREDDAAPVEWRYRGQRPHFMEVAGYRVMVEFDKSDSDVADETNHGTTLKVDGLSLEGQRVAMQEPARWLIVSTLTPAARDSVVGWIEDLAAEERARDNPPLMHMVRWSGWEDKRRPLRHRPPETLFLAPGVWDELTGDLDKFYASEERYRQLGLPWRRGYMLSGPPGTGKTSAVMALASHYRKDVWMIQLADITADGEFINLVSWASGGFLVLEDIDIAGATHDRGEESAKSDRLTLAGLLNGIDGLATPEGIVVFMMSNRPEVLDEALVRDGRVDRRVEIGYAAPQQLIDAYRSVYHRDPPGPLPERIADIGMSAVMEVFKRHLHPEQAQDAWSALLAKVAF